MAVLPRYHVPRPRLVERLAEGPPLGLVEAGGGYGKSVLAVEYQLQLGIVAVEVTLDARARNPSVQAARFLEAARRAGIGDLTSQLGDAGADPPAMLARFLDWLDGTSQPVLIVAEGAHHVRASPSLLVEFGSRIPDRHRVVLLARPMPEAPIAPTADLVALDTSDLAFTPEEIEALCRDGFGLSVDRPVVGELHRATAGWPTAVVLAARRVAENGEPAAGSELVARAMAAIANVVQAAMHDVDEADRTAVSQLAHLPLIDAEVATAATGVDGILARAAASGLPLGLRADAWWEFPPAVRRYLSSTAPLQTDVARRAAHVYGQRGEVGRAVDVLMSVGGDDAAAELLAGLPLQAVDNLDYVDLRDMTDALPSAATQSHPRALLLLARACEPAGQLRLRSTLLANAGTVADVRGDTALVREVAAERVLDLVRKGEATASDAASHFDATRSDEQEVRTRATFALGLATAYAGDLAAAEPLLDQVVVLSRQLGSRTWTAQARLDLARDVYLAAGDHGRALAGIDQALAELPGRSRLRAEALIVRADVLADCARSAEAEADLGEARDIARVIEDHRAAARGAWQAARIASYLGDRARAVAEVRLVEQHATDWFNQPEGAVFLAEAADLLDRVGETSLAAEFLERARARRGEAETHVLLAEGATLARSGDPATAEKLLLAATRTGRLVPRERWRVTLLRAYAAWRRGDRGAATLAVRAFQQATELGVPALPSIREPAVVERLVALTGPEAAHGRVVVQMLGGFAVSRGGKDVTPGPGRAAQLLKLVVSSGGVIHVEEAIESLWTDVDASAGRRRFRTVLARLRERCGDVVVRQGSSLLLADGVEVDAVRFDTQATAALTADRPEEGFALGRAALAWYRGELLPGDRYEPWTAGPRERTRRKALAVLDLVADHLESTGEAQEAVRMVDRAVELEHFGEARYVRQARLLLSLGRRGEARAVIDRAKAMLVELGVTPSHELTEVEARLRPD